MKRVSDTPAAKKISAYIILKDGQYVGKAQAHHTSSRTFVNLWLDGLSSGFIKFPDGSKITNYMLEGSASGYGYNKEDAAFSHAFRDVTGNDLPFDVTAYEFYSKINSSGLQALEDHGYQVIQAI